MASQSRPFRSSRIPQYFNADLLEIGAESDQGRTQRYRVFRVLSDVLSDLDIRRGSVLSMRAIQSGDSPKAHAIVAVRFIWSSALLLRQFVPPRTLITNSRGENYPHLHLSRSLRIIAQIDRRNNG
jgi:hypothetical protein